MSAPQKYTGWAPTPDNKKGHIHLAKTDFEPKVWDENDIEVKIKYCGICGTDSHILAEEWGPIDRNLTYVCGHELVGEVVKVGSAVKDRKVGDHVGVGYQSDSCGECDFCTSGNEQCCEKMVATLSGVGNKPYIHGNAGAAKSLPKGGFANYWRGPAKFSVAIPKGMDLAGVAPMFCGGITMFSPLERMGAGTTRKRVGIVGVGGLGHYGIMFAKAMGAEVTAISRSRDKEEDAKKLGADHYIAMSEGTQKYKNSLDLILCTISPSNFDPVVYLDLLRPYGDLTLIGPLPKPMTLPSSALLFKQTSISGSLIGSPSQIERMLKLAVEKNLTSWYQKYSFEDINTAFEDFEAGKPRFRFVLVNEDNGGKL